jgi:hypothetical protein
MLYRSACGSGNTLVYLLEVTISILGQDTDYRGCYSVSFGKGHPITGHQGPRKGVEV